MNKKTRRFKAFQQRVEPLWRHLVLKSFHRTQENNNINMMHNAQIIPKLNGNPAPLKFRLAPETLRALCARHGLTLLQKEKELCTAGADMYIRHDGKISGCPVLKTELDVTIFEPSRVIYEFIQNMRVIFDKKTCDYGNCPAWQKLEDQKSRTTFLNAVMRASNAFAI